MPLVAMTQEGMDSFKEGQEYLALGKKKKAIKSFESALEAAEESKNIKLQIDCHRLLAELKDNLIQHKESIGHYKAFSALYQQQAKEKAEKLKQSVTYLQSEVKEGEQLILDQNEAIDLLTKDQLKAQYKILQLVNENNINQLKIEEQNNKKNKLVFAIILLSLVSLVIVLMYFQKKKANRLLRHKNVIIRGEKQKSEKLLEKISLQNTELEKRNHEKEILLKEIHHRVKNNLQIIVSLLNLQSAKFMDDRFLKAFSETKNRVISMSLVHQKMYQNVNFKGVPFQDYLDLIFDNNGTLFETEQLTVKFENNVPENLNLEIETAIPLGLILNELISNSYKYAFESVEKAVISIEYTVLDNDQFNLTYSDNGVGMPDDFDYKNSTTLGFELVHALAEQIDSTVEVYNANGFHISFSLPNTCLFNEDVIE